MLYDSLFQPPPPTQLIPNPSPDGISDHGLIGGLMHNKQCECVLLMQIIRRGRKREKYSLKYIKSSFIHFNVFICMCKC